MKAIFYGIAAIGGLVLYEAVQGFKSQPAYSATRNALRLADQNAPSNSTQPSVYGPSIPTGSGIPADWLTALAAHESPSALQGNFNYGAFGLSCGAGQGYASGCTPPLPSKDPTQAYTPPLDLFSGWDTAVAGLKAWINRNAPEAYGATSCPQFMAILQSHLYGNLAGTC